MSRNPPLLQLQGVHLLHLLHHHHHLLHHQLHLHLHHLLLLHLLLLLPHSSYAAHVALRGVSYLYSVTLTCHLEDLQKAP